MTELLNNTISEENQAVDDTEFQTDFYENLAARLPESVNNKIASFLLELIDEDKKARQDWMDSVDRVKNYLGFSLEDMEKDAFQGATLTYDTTLTTALIRFFSVVRAELLPAGGPVGFKIKGQEMEVLRQKGQLISDWMNYFLTVRDQGYYSDFDRCLLYLGLYGSCFKKVYFDDITNAPISRFIQPKDFIVDGDCSSVMDSTRITHVLRLTKREILLKQQNGNYLDIELPYLKSAEATGDKDNDRSTDEFNSERSTKQSQFTIYEVHTYLSVEDFLDSSYTPEVNFPLPYVITLDKETEKILAIRPNWENGDAAFKRINYFVQYNYLPGFGIYGLGLAHLIGTNSITLTKLIRQLLDSGSFQNLPAAVRAKGFKQDDNDAVIGVGEIREIDTGGQPLRDAFHPLPFNGPSEALRQLRIEVIEQTKELASTSELGMMESKEDISTGTTLAMMEANNRIQSAILRCIHQSFSYELQLLYSFFKGNLEYEQFTYNGAATGIASNDFIDELKIIPISNPAVNSTTHKLVRAQAVFSTAAQFPELHNMPEVLRFNYNAQGLEEDEIARILLPAAGSEEVMSLDPITENMNSLQNMPLRAAIWQDHAAHKLLHGMFAESNPDVGPAIAAHIAEHTAYEYLINMQTMLGYEIPPLEQLQDPNIQNRIALDAAMAANATLEQQEGAEGNLIDPNAVVMADIAQKQEDTATKERIAQLKAKTDVFKSQLDFEKQKAKIESEEDIAELRADTELEKANLTRKV